MVLFYLFMSLAEGEGRYIAGPGDPAGYGSIARFFLKMVLGGIGLGFAFFGFAALVCLQLARRKYDETATTLQITVTVGVAYLSFYVADSLCGCSGVLSTVFAALVIARFGWVHVTSRETMVSVWEFLGYLANTLIFMLAGSLTGEILYENWHERGGDEPHWLGPYDYFVLLYTWAALMLIRGVMMVGLWPLLSYFERHHSSTKMLDWRDGVVMTWGGLRGAVGLALAMVVDEHIEVAGITLRAAVKFPQQLLFLVAGVSFLTLLVNGWTSASLLNYLKMTTPSEDTKHLRIYARTQAEKKAAEAFAEIATNAMAYDAATFGGGVVAAGLNDGAGDDAPVAAGDVPQRMRGLFLRTLKAEYWKMIELGLIPPGSAASQILPTSCDAAMDHIATDLRDFMVVERAARDLKGAEYLNKVEGGCVKAFGFAASSNQRYYVLLAYKAAHLHTLAHVRDVFGYFVSSGAFAVDLRADFYAEVEAQISQCQAYMDQTFPREEHAAINRDLVAEVLLEIKHDVCVKLEEEGLLATKDRDILAEHLIEATNELHKKRAEDAERLRRSTLELAKEKKANAKKGRVAPADDAEAKDAEPEPDAAAAKLQARVRGKQERAHPKAPAPPAGVAYDVDVAAVAAAPAAAPGLVVEETPRAKSPSNRLAPLQ
ncbi:potassium:proton antiporter [Aureococcus anophagefferens]|nr:potassium:proton antiporter [Aureococcus anophagefferens]